MLVAQWQNPARPADVNNDGIAVPLDALLVFNRIREAGAGTLPQRTNPLDRYYDVNGDNELTPLDALLVLNEISRGLPDGHYINGRVEGESEVAPAGFISMPLASLPGQSGELVDLSTSITIGSREFNEMGVFVVDTADGMMGNLSPTSPGYANAVFASGHRHVLYSRRDILRDSRGITLPANSQVHVYVLQGFSDDGDPAKHIRVRENDAGSMRIGWEEQAVVSHWPIVGDRYFDDVIVDVQVGSPYAGTTRPVLNFIPNQMVAELTELQVQAIAVDAELPNDVLTFSLDAAPPGVSLNALSGLLTWTPTEAQGPGTYPITIRVTDQAGNFDTRTFQVTVLEVNLPPVLEPIPDRSVRPTDVITINAVAADPDIPANRLTFSLDFGAPAGAWIDPVSGQFQWTAPDVATSTAFPITVRVTDNGSPRLSATQSFTITVNPLVDCAFDDQLTGWTVFESGGSSTGRGTVVAGNCTATLTEGDSFVVGLERSFTIPDTPTTIQFTYDNLAFDTTDLNFIKDAFEVALVDRDGNPLVAPFTAGRDAFFNITEGMQAAAGQGIQVDGNTITVGLNGIPVGTETKIIFRLANNDEDVGSFVRLVNFELFESSLPAPQALENLSREIDSDASARIHAAALFPSTELLTANGEPSQQVDNSPSAGHGSVVAIGDEWLLSDGAFIRNAEQASILAENITTYFSPDGAGNFLVASSLLVRGVTGQRLATHVRSLGHSWEINPSFEFTDESLKEYDAVFLAGNVGSGLNNAEVLSNYVRQGGSVLVMAGTGTIAGGAQGEAAVWNPFLRDFGLKFGNTWFAPISTTLVPVVNDPHPLAGSLEFILWRYGQKVIDLTPEDSISEIAIRGDFTSQTGPFSGLNGVVGVNNTSSFGLPGAPLLTVSSPTNRASANSIVTISGLVSFQPATNGMPNGISLLTVNQTQLEVIDGGGRFHTGVELREGLNEYSFVATDFFGRSTAATVYITGTSSDAIDFSRYSDITGSFSGTYFRMSFNE